MDNGLNVRFPCEASCRSRLTEPSGLRSNPIDPLPLYPSVGATRTKESPDRTHGSENGGNNGLAPVSRASSRRKAQDAMRPLAIRQDQPLRPETKRDRSF